MINQNNNDVAIEMLRQDIEACQQDYEAKYSYLATLQPSFEESNIVKCLNKCYLAILKNNGENADYTKLELENFSDIFQSNYLMGDGILKIDLVDEFTKELICEYEITIVKSKPMHFKKNKGTVSEQSITQPPFVRFHFPVEGYVVCLHFSQERNKEDATQS